MLQYEGCREGARVTRGKRGGGDTRDAERGRERKKGVGGGRSLGVYECSHILALNAAFIDVLTSLSNHLVRIICPLAAVN